MAAQSGYTGLTNVIVDKIQVGQSAPKPVSRMLLGTVNVDLANLAGTVAPAAITVSITGAQVGDIVILTPDVSLLSPTASRIIAYAARVSAANTVEITYDSAGTGNLAAGTWSYLIIG